MWDGEVIFILKLGAKKGQQTWNEMFLEEIVFPRDTQLQTVVLIFAKFKVTAT